MARQRQSNLLQDALRTARYFVKPPKRQRTEPLRSFSDLPSARLSALDVMRLSPQAGAIRQAASGFAQASAQPFASFGIKPAQEFQELVAAKTPPPTTTTEKVARFAGEAAPMVVTAAGAESYLLARFPRLAQGIARLSGVPRIGRPLALGARAAVDVPITTPLFRERKRKVTGIPTDIAGAFAFGAPFALLGKTEGPEVIGREAKQLAPFTGFKDLTTKVIEKLKGRTRVSRQFISDLTNAPDLKQGERNIIRGVLGEFPGKKIGVREFAEKVKRELLPLKTFSSAEVPDVSMPRYESITLPPELRGGVASYAEHIYESPIKNSAGGIHFDREVFPNYFAHARVEDIVPTKAEAAKVLKGEMRLRPETRRIIELQSDLFQKGRLEKRLGIDINLNARIANAKWRIKTGDRTGKLALQGALQEKEASKEILNQLQPYRNIWHERIIKEEIKRAAQDGKTKLQFPTGETAMRIEGLGGTSIWYKGASQLTSEILRVGDTISRQRPAFRRPGNEWIITDVLGDGKFKAVPKQIIEYNPNVLTQGELYMNNRRVSREEFLRPHEETFDISGKIDTQSRIYRFYEKDVQKYLKRVAPDMKRITDPQGVDWFEVNVRPEKARLPVEAFGVAAGIETDEEGKVRFSPKKAAVGVVGVAGLAKVRGPLKPPEIPFQFNVERLDIPKEFKDEAADVINRNIREFQAQRRGTQKFTKFDNIEKLADKVGMTKEDFLKTKPGTTFNDDEMAVLDASLGHVGRKMKALADQIASGGDSLINRAELARLQNEYVTLLKTTAGAGSEAGRTLRSLQEFKRAMDLPEQRRLEIMRKFADKLDDEAIGRLAQVDPTNEKELFAFLRSVDKPNFGDYINEYWLNSILSGPATHARNTVGNTLFALLELPVRATRAAIDIPVAKLQGRQREFYMREVLPASFGLVRGIPAGVARGLTILRKGYDIERTAKLVPARGEAFARAPSKIVRKIAPVISAPIRALVAEDAVFKSMNFSSEMHALAIRQAIKEGLAGSKMSKRVAQLIGDPTPEMVVQASKFSRFATFTDKISPIARSFLQLRDKVPGMRFLVPFVSIADRLLMRGLELTPAGFAMAAKKTGPKVSDLTARALIGTGLMTALAAYSMEGKVTGPPPRNRTERDKFYRSGKQPWSVRIGDRWVPFRQIDPISTPLTIVAGFHNAWQENGEMPTEQKLMAAATSIGNNLLQDKSYLSGVADFLQAMERGEKAPQEVPRLVTRQLAGFIPFSSLQRSIATFQDPRLVRTETLKGQIRAQVPGLRKTLPARLDVFGREITPATGRGRAVLPGGTPFVPTKEQVETIDKELEAAGVSVGFVGGRIGGRKLSPDEQADYQRIAGQLSRELILEIADTPEYQVASGDKKKKALEKIVRKVRKKTRDRIQARWIRKQIKGKSRAEAKKLLKQYAKERILTDDVLDVL